MAPKVKVTPCWQLMVLASIISVAQSQSTANELGVFNIAENAPVGSVVGTLPVIPRSQYALMVNRNTPFTIGARTGIIHTTGRLDRELINVYHFLVVILADDNPSDYSTSATVVINVQDVNDNAPMFPRQTFQATIQDSGRLAGTTLLYVGAMDRDAGINSHLTYSISSAQPPSAMEKFSIDSNSGRITVASNLPRPGLSNDRYSLVVTATDGGGLVGECNVNIIVEGNSRS